MLALKCLSTIGRRKIVMNLIYKTSNRTLTSFYRYHQSSIKLFPIGIYCNDKVTISKCKFHTTQRLCISPALALVIRPLTRIGAFLFGRLFKRWWSRKTPEEKEKYKKWFFTRRRKIYGAFGLLLASLFIGYAMHLETDPLTGRTRLIILNAEQQDALGKLTLESLLETHADSLVPGNHPAYIKLTRITNRLLEANAALPQVAKRQWSLTVVNSDMKNAFVLPGGNIFVFLGALKMAENDDQLAMILAHEIAHVLLLHPIELVSRSVILDIFLAIPIAFLWAMFPGLLAIVLQALGINIANILLTLPYSRKLENEADDVGLKLAAKACFDVREAVVFWGLMKSLTELDVEPKEILWLSTHPNHEDRQQNLSAKLSDAIKLRMESKCPKLNPDDPIKFFNALTIKEREARFKAKGIL